MKQVCQLHGKPDDIVYCPKSNCQMGRIAMWCNELPAGTEECGICHGKGVMTRKEKDAIFLRYDAASRPPCICWALKD